MTQKKRKGRKSRAAGASPPPAPAPPPPLSPPSSITLHSFPIPLSGWRKVESREEDKKRRRNLSTRPPGRRARTRGGHTRSREGRRPGRHVLFMARCKLRPMMMMMTTVVMEVRVMVTMVRWEARVVLRIGVFCPPSVTWQSFPRAGRDVVSNRVSGKAIRNQSWNRKRK